MAFHVGSFECNKVFRDDKKQAWNYISINEMQELYPNGGYRILGDLSPKNTDDSLVLIGEDGEEHFLRPYSSKENSKEHVVGYIPLDEEDCFVRVVRKKHGRFLAVTILLCLLLTIFFGGLWLGQANRPVDDPVKIASGEMSNPNPENIRLPGITEVHATAGNTRVRQLLLNVEGNAVNLTYTITLTDTGEEIYQSKVIEPGYGVREFDMNRSFESGEYPITIHVASSAMDDYDGDTSAAFNAGQLDAVLIVEEE
ncbi:hypothetical protein [Clostridium sp. AUH-JLR23]|uniref:hypothetical protein n=1 Tax=Clostridium sp. AUH-JLR23 TaxID=1505062 RepID=UPI00356AB8C9